MARKGDRLNIGMSRFAQAIEEAIGERSVQEFADGCNLPYWVIRDALKEKSRSPRVEHLPGFASGLAKTIDEVIELIRHTEIRA